MKVNEYRVVKTENYGIPKLSLAHTYETTYNGEDDYKALADMLDEIFQLSHLNEEYLYIIAMDTNYHIKGIYEASHGNYNSVPIYSRELYTFLLLAGAESFVAVHNHPDGNTKISDNDINWTSVMKICGNILNISFLKHIIVTEEQILFVDDDGEEEFMTGIDENHKKYIITDMEYISVSKKLTYLERKVIMLDNFLKQEIDKYIAVNYIEFYDNTDYGFLPDIDVKESRKDFSDKETFTLEQLMEDVGKSFREILFEFIDKSGMTDVQVYKRAGIDRKLFSKIRSNLLYHPRKQTVLALAVALRLNIEDTVDLLTSAEYALSPGNKGDLIVKYFIEHGVFDIMTINFALDEYKQAILG